MNLNGGAQALPSAVDNFLTYFDNANDQVADVSYASLASVDVPIQTNFVTPITNAVGRMAYVGATYSQSALLAGQTQINKIVVAPGANVVKVAVFFTDGWANTVQNTLNCPKSTLLNFGGCSPPESAANWCGNPPSNIFWMDPNSGNTLNNSACNATQFLSQQYGNEQLTQLNVANDAMYRALQVANNMRAQNIVIYSIGLGDKISQAFLQQIANDPASSTFKQTRQWDRRCSRPPPRICKASFRPLPRRFSCVCRSRMSESAKMQWSAHCSRRESTTANARGTESGAS